MTSKYIHHYLVRFWQFYDSTFDGMRRIFGDGTIPLDPELKSIHCVVISQYEF